VVSEVTDSHTNKHTHKLSTVTLTACACASRVNYHSAYILRTVDKKYISRKVFFGEEFIHTWAILNALPNEILLTSVSESELKHTQYVNKNTFILFFTVLHVLAMLLCN
jgi:hypothetical protein